MPYSNKHVTAGEDGGTSKKGKMTEGDKGDEHLEAARDGRHTARMQMLQFLNENRGGGWRIVPARPRNPPQFGVMNRDEGSGEMLRSGFSPCFAQGAYTHTSQQIKEMIKK